MSTTVRTCALKIALLAVLFAGSGCRDNASDSAAERGTVGVVELKSPLQEPESPEPVAEPSAQAAAIAENLSNGLYTAIVLHKGESVDDLQRSVTSLVEASEKIACVVADTRDASLHPLFRELQLDPETAPTPLTMVLAPNKVVTGIFMTAPSSEQLSEAILPEEPLAIRRALMDGNTVIVKMQSDTSTGNKETDKAIAEVLAGIGKGAKLVAIPVALDKPENAPFVRQLRVDPEGETNSVILAMAPPLQIISKPFRGAATKDIVTALIRPSCGSGCGSGST